LNPLSRAVATFAILIALLSPMAILATPGRTHTIGASVADLAFGGDPRINSSEPSRIAYVGQLFVSNITCTGPDNGTTTWSLQTDASWLAVGSGGTDFAYCNLSGYPALAGRYWANLTVNDTDSFDFLNWTIEVREQGYWGVVETLSSLPTGTHDPYTGNLSGGRLSLIDASSDEESVVLEGTLATYSRAYLSNQTVAEYVPNHVNDGLGWNMSVELYPTREESSYRGVSKPVPKLGVQIYLRDDVANMTAVALYVGDRTLGLERVSVLDSTTGIWSSLSLDILPSYPNRHDDNPTGPQLSESIYGERPDHYLVSFRYAEGSSVVRITILHTSGVLVGSLDVPLSSPIASSPKLVFVVDDEIPGTPQRGYWMIDDLCFRGLNSEYPVAGPVYEYVTKGKSVWVSVKNLEGVPIQSADVSIAGHHAAYNSTSMRYEAAVPMSVGWSQLVQYSVAAGGVTISDSFLVTVMPDLAGQKVSLPLWWNGWAWVSVFGRDDSAYSTAATDTYSAYNHPATSYIMSSSGGGSSADLLPTQSEMGIHWPHDYAAWPQNFWEEAVLSSDTGHDALENTYAFASRWDNPSYVGVGDTYISIACPGNSASWEQAFAEFERGTRIMGIASNYYNGAAGNSSLMGSWSSAPIPKVSTSWNPPLSNWYSYTPYDMLDAARGTNTDVILNPDEWNLTFWMAQNGGVRRIYNHGVVTPTASVWLHWIDDPKTNFSYENWKATDGEAASYVDGRWSTDVTYDDARSNATMDVYDVARADPISAGYWRVPVTLAYNASGRHLTDIQIIEGSIVLHMNDGSLRNITGKRVMDVGYDIRGDTIYVSYFWNSSAEIAFVFAESGPEPNTPPTASFVADSYHDNVTKTFVFDASASTDQEDPLSALEFRWDWEGDGFWDTDWSSNPVAYHQFIVPGNYTVKVQVMDRGGLTDEAQANVEVTDIEIPEIGGVFLVTVSMVLIFVCLSSLSRRRSNRRRL
jgi:hypothetical protein